MPVIEPEPHRLAAEHAAHAAAGEHTHELTGIAWANVRQRALDTKARSWCGRGEPRPEPIDAARAVGLVSPQRLQRGAR